MKDHSLSAFVLQTQQKEANNGYFELEQPQMLEINLNNDSVSPRTEVWWPTLEILPFNAKVCLLEVLVIL